MDSKEKYFSADASAESAKPESMANGETQDVFPEGAFQNASFAKNRAAQSAHDIYASHGMDMPDTQNNTTGGMFTGIDEGSIDGSVLFSKDSDNANSLEHISDEELMALCRPRLCSQCLVAKEANEQRLRALAEVDNARKRMAREKEEQVRYAAEAVLQDIIPALDNLELALHHASKDEVCKNFVIGVDMTNKILLDSLKKHGLEKVGMVGETFDPVIHEAVGMEDVADIPDGHVGALLSCGYKLKERLLRPARVVVCKKA